MSLNSKAVLPDLVMALAPRLLRLIVTAPVLEAAATNLNV